MGGVAGWGKTASEIVVGCKAGSNCCEWQGGEGWGKVANEIVVGGRVGWGLVEFLVKLCVGGGAGWGGV